MALYGVWNSETEGFVDGPFYTRWRAQLAINSWADVYQSYPYALAVLEYCPDHVNEEQPKLGCEECFKQKKAA